MAIRFQGVVVVLLCGAGCASQSAHGPRVRTEFTADDALLFEDGVDLIENPDQLEGQWRTDWDRALDRRIGSGDAIVTGSVTTLRDDIDLEHRTSYQIVLSVEQVLLGDRPGSELTLISRQGAAGYASVADHRDHLLGRKLVAFVRYAAGEGGAVITHFHLAAPSSTVLDRVATFEAQKHPTSVHVVEHRE